MAVTKPKELKQSPDADSCASKHLKPKNVKKIREEKTPSLPLQVPRN